MSVIYYHNETQCSGCSLNEHICFKYITVEAGTCFEMNERRDKHIFFFLEGDIKMRYNEFSERVFSGGEMIFLPRSADCKAEAVTSCSFIVLVYDNMVKLYDNVTFMSFLQQSKEVNYEFKSLPIVKEIRGFLDLLRRYLIDGIESRCLHEIKEKELFLLLGAYYKKEKLIQFFFPMIGKSMDFRSRVMANYLTSRTVKELARACLYSDRQFYKLFVEEFSISPYSWMQKQKSKHITGRLYEKEIPIKEIINEFNFTSQSQFNRYCIKQFGDTPQRIRRMLNAENQDIGRE